MMFSHIMKLYEGQSNGILQGLRIAGWRGPENWTKLSLLNCVEYILDEVHKAPGIKVYESINPWLWRN